MKKRFAAEVEALDALFGEFALDYHLGGDAGVVGAGKPESIFAEHAMPADGDVDLGVFEHVADVENAGDVRGRDDEREDFGAGLGGCLEDAGIDPPLGPVRLEMLGGVDFI